MKYIAVWSLVGSQVISSLVYAAGPECIIQREEGTGTGEYYLTFTNTSCLDDYVKRQTAAISQGVTDNSKAINISAGNIETKANKTSLVQGLTSIQHYTNQQVKEVKSEVDRNAEKIKKNGDYTFRKGEDILKKSKQYTDQQFQEVKSEVDSNAKKIKENGNYTYRKGWDVYNKVMSVLSGEPNLLEIDYDTSCQPSSYRAHDEPPYHVYIAALGNGNNAYNSDTAYFKVNTQYPSFITLSSNGAGDVAGGVGIAITNSVTSGYAIDANDIVYIRKEPDICSDNNNKCDRTVKLALDSNEPGGHDLAHVRQLTISDSSHKKHYAIREPIHTTSGSGYAKLIWPFDLDYNPFVDNNGIGNDDRSAHALSNLAYSFTKPYGYILVHCGN